MKRSGFKSRGKPLRRTALGKKPKPMKQISDSRKKYRNSVEGKAAAEYMAKVKQLPCAITGKAGPSDVHHCISGRYGSRKASDWDVIPLCVELHRYPYPDAIHTNKRAWEEKHGPDTDYIEQTRRLVEDMD